MHPRWVVGVVVAGLLATAVGFGVVATVGADSGSQGPAPVTTPDGFDSTVFEIRVYENGSARWTLQHVKLLENGSQIESFRSFADRFESTDTELFRNFRARATQLTAFGTNATGREMTATDFDRQAYVNQVGQTRGVVELSFRWTNLGQETGDAVLVSDIFEGGMFITDDQRLEFRRGPRVRFASVDPPPDSTSVQGNLSTSESITWFGENQFANRRPQVEFVPVTTADSGGDENTQAGGSGAGDPNDSGDAGSTATASKKGGTGTPPGDGSGAGMAPMIFAVVLLLGAAGGLAWYSGALSDRGSGRPDSGAAEAESTDGPDTPATTATPETRTEEPAVPPEELLSDEDRVLSLLEENGGRMKQVAIVEETDWSKSKVSMLLSEMAEEGEISKLRVGRENIISLAGEEPEASKSPFEDE